MDALDQERLSTQNSEDDAALLRIGRKPAIGRKYGRWTMFAFSCLVIDQWIAVVYTFQIGYTNGGSAGLVYGFFVAWVGTLASFASLAELASMAPVSAGQYYWSAMVWPRAWAKLLSYITGWMTVLGWQAGLASGAFAAALLLQTFIQIVDPSSVPHLWHTTLLYYGVLLAGLLVTVFSGKPFKWIQTGALVLYVCGILAVMLPLVILSPHADAKTVFTSFENGGGWSTQGLSFMVGLAGVAFIFSGADCVYHMSEEVHNARIIVPWSMIIALCVGGILGFLTTIGILFCIPNPEAILNSSYEYPFATILLQATKSRAGSAVMTMIIILLQVAAVTGIVSAASRMLWSFARDKGIPASAWFSRVSTKSSIPRNAVLLTTVFCVLVGLISLGSPVAFNDLLSLAIGALYGSYLIACLGLLWRRIRGDILPYGSVTNDEPINIPGSGGQLVWGPWHIPGVLGTAINAFGCAYLIVIFFFIFWPTTTPTTAREMNYAVLLFGAVATFSGAYYLTWGKKTFRGPAVDTTLAGEGVASKSA